MSKNQSRKIRDLAKYDAMATEELKQILRLDSEAPEEQELDTEEILYILEVLAGREKETITGNTAQEAWDSFQRDYLPEAEELSSYTYEAKKSSKTRTPWLRRLTAAAAVIALVLCISTTADALSWKDIWNAVAKWAKETFSFVDGSNTELTEPETQWTQQYSSLQDALAETDRDCDLVPAWIPDRYVLKEIIVKETPAQQVYMAIYDNNGKNMKITVRSYLNSDPEKVEIDNSLLESYTLAGTEYYIFQNNVQLRVAWVKDSYECYISGELTIEELKTMIDSIGKG